MAFDEQTLDLLVAAHEVEVETTRPDGRQTRTVIWVMVDDGDVFVRSVRGERGHWFQAALDAPDHVALVVDGRRVPVAVQLASDHDSIARCTRALKAKYRPGASLRSMIQPYNLASTLRLLPRPAPDKE